LLDITLTYNHGHFDTVIVVTTIQDEATQKVANKHGAITVQTDLSRRNFNKGAAINAGFSRKCRLVAPPGRPLPVDRAIAAPHTSGGGRPGSTPAPVARAPLGVSPPLGKAYLHDHDRLLSLARLQLSFFGWRRG
jgi:hypothetical protein